ncbi:hypothetical protein GCM10023185_45810 [Hymenobacter saemangeumensis]|uniref:Uncharacterized protein n=1 Tax=Hymenobacter saemangeumensis TaxID=1084522 RepID=A0ABP8ITB1_9BACT
MAFNGTEGSPINPEIAGTWTRKYRSLHKGENTGHFFGREILLKLLQQPGAMGIRFYYGVDGENRRQLLAVAVGADQNDQIGSERIVADDSCACPPWVSIANVLNS